VEERKMKRKDKKVIAHPGLYRAVLSCKIGRDAIEGKSVPPEAARGYDLREWGIRCDLPHLRA